ncbi:MAG: hypothetical protein MK100_02190, partial [Phycisphaerales bacterium]|nr:hypothetical protein [Phycisphaerales bacterium]
MSADPVSSTSATRQLIGETAASDAVRSAMDWLGTMVEGWGLTESLAQIVAAAIAIAAILTICVAANYLAKGFIRGIAHHPLRRSEAPWAKAIMKEKVLLRLSQLIPIALLALA